MVFVFATKKHQGRHSPRGLALGRGGNGREGHCATGIDLARIDMYINSLHTIDELCPYIYMYIYIWLKNARNHPEANIYIYIYIQYYSI